MQPMAAASAPWVALAWTMGAGAAATEPEALPTPTRPRVALYLPQGAATSAQALRAAPLPDAVGSKGEPCPAECGDPVVGALKKGTTVQVLTTWLLPVDGRWDDVSIQIAHEGVVRSAFPGRSLAGASGAGRPVQLLSKAGRWEVKGRAEKELGTAALLVE